jgi:uncharacterized protein YutE (UPF0331/DUF86 family)
MIEKDVILSKISIIKNCLKSIENATGLDPERLDDRFTQDVFVLNLQRAVQACVDMANTVIAMEGFKLPASYKESFTILARNRVIDAAMEEEMKRMTGFRNIAVHDYQSLDIGILKSILRNKLPGVERFYQTIYDHVIRK